MSFEPQTNFLAPAKGLERPFDFSELPTTVVFISMCGIQPSTMVVIIVCQWWLDSVVMAVLLFPLNAKNKRLETEKKIGV